MTKVTPEYLPAMKALNDFYAMLYQAMLSAMPDVKISTTGAYGWRGYRIDLYQSLAINQYYCQFYPHEPNVLLFKESFNFKGKYQNPFVIKKDLHEAGFFSMIQLEQLSFLTDFVQTAAEQALIWQESEERKNIVPEEFLMGKPIRRRELKVEISFKKVPEVFLRAFPMQDHFFKLLASAIEKACKEVFQREADLHENNNWQNWEFRGYRMKIRKTTGEIPKGSSDFTWRIYFDSPDLLNCELYKGRGYSAILPFHLDIDFLSASEQEQSEHLYQYALQALKIGQINYRPS